MKLVKGVKNNYNRVEEGDEETDPTEQEPPPKG